VEGIVATITKRTDGTGRVRWQAKVRLRGHPARSKTFARLTDARRWAAAAETAIKDRRYFPSTESERHTLRDLCERYIHDVLPAKKNARKVSQHLRWWDEQIGQYSLASITPAVIAEARDTLSRSGVQPATVVRYLASLSVAFSTAVKEWGWVHENPVLKVSWPTEARGRIRFLSDDERAPAQSMQGIRQRISISGRRPVPRHRHAPG